MMSSRRLAAALGALALAMALIAPASATAVLAANDDSATTTQGALLKVKVLANDTAPEGMTTDDLEVVAVSAPSHGTATIYDGWAVKYAPDASFVGTDSFTYTISDGTAAATATVTVTVKAKVEKPAQKPTEKPASKPETTKSTSAANAAAVNEACEAHAATVPALSSLCALYTGGQLPAWAAESIGHVILKLAPKPDPVVEACKATGLDEDLQALCVLYESERLPAGIHKQIGKFILELSNGGTVSAVKLKP